MSTRILCIGGPLDGHTVPNEGLREFDAMEIRNEGDKSASYAVAYTLRQISCDGQPAIQFFTSEGVGEYAAIVRVFTAYAKSGKVGR